MSLDSTPYNNLNHYQSIIIIISCSGKYNIFVNGKQVGAYDGHGSFGELALMYNMPRAATIQVNFSFAKYM